MTESTQRRAAHERLSTGALSRWMRRCATHPWRVIGAWLGIFAVLVVLTISFAGSLRDEFEIPGSDTQKATDLIEAEFAEEQGGVLNVVFAAPPGQRLDTPEQKQAIDEAIAQLRGAEFKPTEDKAGLESVETPFTEDTVSDDGRIAYAEAQFDRVIYDEGSRVGRCRPGRCPRDGRARRRAPWSSTATRSSRRSSRERRSCSACSRP